MAELDDFNIKQEEEANLSDFRSDAPKTPAFNKQSASNLAAKAAILKGDGNVVETYNQINVEMEENGISETAMKTVEEAQVMSQEETRNTVVDLLSDPNLPEEAKKLAADSFAENATRDISINKLIGERAASEPSSQFETNEESETRLDVGAAMDEVNNYRAFVQKHLNASAMKNNKSSMSELADIFEIMIPFAEQGLATNLSTLFKSDNPKDVIEGFALLGKNKAAMRDWFAKLPLEKRREMIPKIIQLVNSSDTIIFDETNDFVRNDFLRTIIDDGYYGYADEILDNTTSILDLIGLGGAVRGVAKGRKLSKMNKKAVQDEADFVGPRDLSPAERKKFSERNVVSAPNNTKAIPDEDFIGPRLEKELQHAKERIVRSRVQPTSPSQILKDTNPHKARVLHSTTVVDPTGEMAKAVYGTNKTEAVVNDLLPEMGGDIVTSKLAEPDALLAQIQLISDKTNKLEDVKRFVSREQGALYFTEKEKAAARSRVVNDFQNVTGVTSRKEMFKWGTKDDGATIQAVYGPQDGGFLNGERGLETVKIALREYGIAEDQARLLRREGDSYVPVDKNEVGPLPRGDYLVEVDYRYKIKPNEVNYEGMSDVEWNLFDRVPYLRDAPLVGNVMSHVLDTMSMLNPKFTRGASAAVDKSASMKKMLGDVTRELQKDFSSLKKERQALLSDLWKEANAKGFEIDNLVSTARGLTPKEKRISDLWREAWDTMYFLENTDLKKTLSAQGYHIYNDKVHNTNLIAKPIPEAVVRGKAVRAYDPETDKIVIMKKEDVDKFLDKEGSFGKLKSPLEVDGEMVTRIKSNNKVGNGYLRALNANDEVLAYRKGYYHVHYTDPHFIEQKIDLPNGEIKWVAKATAKTASDAENMMERMTSQSGKTYRTRLDRKQTTVEGDSAYEAMVASGRSAQRLRGKRLEDATGSPSVQAAHLMDPAEALGRSINSISARVELRDWLEAAKQRLIAEYADVLPQDKKGLPTYPTSAKEIGKDGNPSSKRAADASTMWNYIRTMEDGYINHVDDFTKAMMRSTADMLGGTKNPLLDAGERFFRNRVDGLGMTSWTKKKAFDLYLALNPLRQIIVQSHQMIQIAGLETKYLATRLMPEAMALTTMSHVLAKKSTKMNDKRLLKALDQLGMTTKEAVDMVKHWEASGLKYAVDTHNLVRSDFAYATKGDYFKQAGELIDKGIKPFQKVGFDAGERANVMSAWLTFRHRAIREGKDLNSPAVAEQVAADARNFTYNMNRAGDLPYNNNALGIVMQFVQVPHKALTQVIANRTLTKTERLRMGLFNIATYGVPGLYIADNYFGDIMPDDENMREVVRRGVESLVLNKTLETITGDDVDIDWSNIAPWDAHGMMDAIHTLFTSGIGEAFMKAPAVQIFNDGGRVNNLLTSASRYFGVARDFEDDPTTFARVATDFAKLSSGFSNAFKAAYTLESGKVLNSYGKQVASATTTEAILQAFGFRTVEETTAYAQSMKMSEPYKEREDDMKKWYKEYKRHMSAEGKPQEYYDNIMTVFNEAFRVFPNDVLTHKFLTKMLKRDMADGDATFYKRVMENSAWMDAGKLRDIIRENDRMSEDDKQELIKRLRVIEEFKEE